MATKRAPATRMQNYGRGHGYFLDGDKVPGVTKILGDGLPKPALLDWAGKMPAQFVVNRLQVVDGHLLADDVYRDALAWNATRTRPERVSNHGFDRLALEKILKDVRYADLDEASGKGTLVHRLAHALAHGEEIDVPDELAGHVESYLRFLDEWDPTDAIVEQVVINRRWRYMGRFDMSATVAGTRWLFDIKTARSGVFAEVALQLEAYDNAETMIVGHDDDGEAIEEPMTHHDRIGAIHVRADGYDVYEFERRPDTFRMFLYCKELADWLDFKDGSSATIRSDALDPPARLEVVS